MAEHDATLSEFDYEQLPPALRRKYFSSLERLRLAQDGAHPFHSSRVPREPQRPLTASNASSFSTRRSTRRPSTTRTIDDNLLVSSSSTRKKLRKPSRTPSITPQQVAHFASLPPTLQRKHFTREEQVLLASRINHVIFDAADEVVYKQYGQKSRSSLDCKDPVVNTSELFEADEDDMELSEDDLNSLRWLDGEDDLDLSLGDYHAAVAETTQRSDTSARWTSYRKGMLASNAPFSRRSSSTLSISAQGAWPLPTTSGAQTVSRSRRSIQSSANIGHRKNRASTSSLDPTAAHYQDPAARMKLRVYLASPQKFDEAIEFGFPSMQEPSATRPPRPTTSPRSTESSNPIGLTDDTPSLSDGDDQDEVEDIDSPRTPEMSAFSSTFSKSKESSLDRTSIKPKMLRDFTDPYLHALSSNREMTLHMTLTRPDLRSPEEVSSTRDINSRPLEQAPLHFSDTSAGFWDSLPDDQSKMKKLFRRLKLR